MSDCGCRKGAVMPGCERHSVLEQTKQPRGWLHRLLIWLGRR